MIVSLTCQNWLLFLCVYNEGKRDIQKDCFFKKDGRFISWFEERLGVFFSLSFLFSNPFFLVGDASMLGF